MSLQKYAFFLRLIPAKFTLMDLLFGPLSNGCGTQKFPISAFQNHLQTKPNLHIFIRQSQFIGAVSI